MSLRTIQIDVISYGGPPYNYIPVINQTSPVYGYTIDEQSLLQLIQMSNMWIYEAGTKKIISGNNYYDYFPKEGGGGGGGGDAYTKKQTDTLLNAKVDKKSGYDLSQEDFTTSMKTKLEGLENYDDTTIKNEIATIVNSGAKNLLPSNAKTISDKGLTAIVDENGIVTISGETSSVSNFELDFPIPTSIKGKKVILTGCPAGGANAGTYQLLVRSLDDSTNLASDIGNGTTFTLPSEFDRIVVRINVFAGYVADNLVFKPMLRLASIEDDAFVPYAPTNHDLYEMIVKHSVTESTVANVVLKNNDTTVITGTPTNINVTLPQPVQGNEYICGCNFIAGSNVSFSDAVEGSCIIKWNKEPTWTAGKLYEIIYRCLWLKNSDGKIIINAVCNEVVL